MLNNTDFLRVLGQTLIKRPSCIWSGDPRLCHEPSNIATWLTQSCLGCLHKSPGRYTLTPGLPTVFGEFSGSALLHFCFRHPYHFWLFFWHNLCPQKPSSQANLQSLGKGAKESLFTLEGTSRTTLEDTSRS